MKEQSKRDRARGRKRDTASVESKAKEKESDRLRKKRDVYRESLVETGKKNVQSTGYSTGYVDNYYALGNTV